MPRDPRVYLKDILEAVRRIGSYTEKMDLVVFAKNDMAIDAVAANPASSAGAQLLGHTSVVTTQRYVRLFDAHVRAEAERIAGQVAAGVAATNLQAIGAHHIPSFKTGSN